jgi:hypothetical protein
MAYEKGWFERLVDGLPETALMKFFARWVLVPFWALRTPTAPQPGGARVAIQPGDNVQHMMNLVMPLKDKSPIGRAHAVQAIAGNLDEVYAGLDNVGTVHFARFVIVDGNLCMISVYDGDFSNYIRDFIATIGGVFDAIVAQVEGGDAVIPCEKNVEAFIDWVHAHDMYQVPDMPTDVLAAWNATNGGTSPMDDDLRLLPRKLILQLRANRDISLGSGYRRYPGFSAAQVRRHLRIGW